MTIPLSLQSVLWSSDIKNINLERDKIYVIHQILAYGNMKDIKWLFTVYPRSIIEHIFTSTPYKDYRRSRFYFVKEMIIGLDHKPLADSSYVKNIPRTIR